MTMVTAVPFTRRDYMQLPEGFPAQLIEGSLIRDPAPTTPHQVLVRRIVFAFAKVVGEERILFSPVDLHLDDENIYQPDLLILQTEMGINPRQREVEMPVLVVEVLSPSTAAYDLGVKSRRYLEWGVHEVWLVDPDARTVEIRGPGGITRSGPDGVARSAAVDGLEVDLERLFRS